MKPICHVIRLSVLLGVASPAAFATVAAASETHQVKVSIAYARARKP